jgi:hypothetical protein
LKEIRSVWDGKRIFSCPNEASFCKHFVFIRTIENPLDITEEASIHFPEFTKGKLGADLREYKEFRPSKELDEIEEYLLSKSCTYISISPRSSQSVSPSREILILLPFLLGALRHRDDHNGSLMEQSEAIFIKLFFFERYVRGLRVLGLEGLEKIKKAIEESSLALFVNRKLIMYAQICKNSRFIK